MKLKKLLTPATVRRVSKHYIIIGITILMALIGVIQSFTWVYDRFIKQLITQPKSQESQVFENVAPGNHSEFLIEYLGTPRKKYETESGNIVNLWRYNDIIVSAIINDKVNSIDSLGIYSHECTEGIPVPQLFEFNLCEEYLPSIIDETYAPFEYVEWTYLLGAQNAGYVEKHDRAKWTRYLYSYYGSDLGALDLISLAFENKALESYGYKYKDKNNLIEMEIRESRDTIKPNFLLLSSRDLSVEEALDQLLTMSNFYYYND
jgi:hypothetical protein